MTEEIKAKLDLNGIKDLENYITNLQQYYNDNVNKYEELLVKYSDLQKENENLKQQLDFIDEQNKYIDKIENKIKDYKQRNEKAIEWCECVVNAKYTSDKLPNGKTTDMGYCLDLAEPLLNILKGGDE